MAPGPPDTQAAGRTGTGTGWRIRHPVASEQAVISAVVDAAFGAAEGRAVADLVHVLRAWWDADRGFELVAEVSAALETPGTIVGHIGMTRAYVDGLEQLHHVLVLSPLAVDPAWQGHGIGQDLVRAALAEARRAGCPLVFLEGEPAFYPRLGFIPAGPAGYTKPSVRIPDAAFMVHDTGAARTGPISGALVYPGAFWQTDTTGLRGTLLRRLCPGLFPRGGRRRPLLNAAGKPTPWGRLPCINAEGKGFEPLVRGCRTLVFKTSSLGRSDNLPDTRTIREGQAARKTAR